MDSHLVADPAVTMMDTSDGVIVNSDEKVEDADTKSEELRVETLADDFEAMKAIHLPPVDDLETLDEAVSTWHVEGYRNLESKERGPLFQCAGASWRVLLFPYGNRTESVSLYLERLDANSKDGQSTDMNPTVDSSARSGEADACAQFTLVMWNKHDPSMSVSQKATHRFDATECDWGFTQFLDIRKLAAPEFEGRGRPFLENDSVMITTYIRVYKDPTGVLWHNFINYDSKKETGLVGLKNQGATCYLNSLIQSLYFTNAFRKAVYQIPTDSESERAKSAWALQRLFYQLQTSNDAVATQELTQSFGWETKHIFEQQDVQELSRVLMERMEERMKGTEAENALPHMFVGKMKTYISCIDVDYVSSRTEEFWDIQLNVSGNKGLEDSFQDYIQVETMDGENKYYAENHGLQAAKKGVIFESFPQVLHLQLKRFEYDINRDAMMKVNDRYEFPATFDASPYLSDEADKSESWIYSLHSVLVHSGDFNAGHYYAFLRPTADGQFYKFDDDRVTRATAKEAMDENFGGEYSIKTSATNMRNPYTKLTSTKRSMSAYMLVYVRQTRIPAILPPVQASDPPAHLARQLDEERAEIERRRKEREEQHLYLSMGVISERAFKKYQGFDLTNWSADQEAATKPHVYRMLRTATLSEAKEQIASTLGIQAAHIRFWVLVNRQNKTIRPDQPLNDEGMTVETAYQKHSGRDKAFKLWAEEAKVFDADGQPVWPCVAAPPKIDDPFLILLKHFNPKAQTLLGIGHLYLARNAKVADIVPRIAELMGWPDFKDELILYEEIKNTMIEPMKLSATLQAAELQDGDIVCFQRTMSKDEAQDLQQSGSISDAKEFYEYLLNRKTVTFYARGSLEDDAGAFKLELSRKSTYDQFSAKVAERLNVSSTHLQFHTINATTNKAKTVVRLGLNQNLAQILSPQFGNYGSSNQRDDALFYEILDMSLTELDTKKTIKVTYISSSLTQPETYDLLVPKSGTTDDLLLALQKRANIDARIMPQIRISEVLNNKICREYHGQASLAPISDYHTIIAEIVPLDERKKDETESEIYCFHFDKESTRTFGMPFALTVRPAEIFRDTKARISARIGIQGKQFEKIRFAVVPRSIYSRTTYLEDEDILANTIRSADDMLGLDHINRVKAIGAKGDSMFIR